MVSAGRGFHSYREQNRIVDGLVKYEKTMEIENGTHLIVQPSSFLVDQLLAGLLISRRVTTSTTLPTPWQLFPKELNSLVRSAKNYV